MNVTRRNSQNKLLFDPLEAQLLFGDIFVFCKTEKEIAYVLEELTAILEGSAEERENEL